MPTEHETELKYPLYSRALERYAKLKKWTPEQKAAFTRWAMIVAETESFSGKETQQRGGGPGRGLFQYELSRGRGDWANKVAARRYQQLLSTLKKRGYKVDDLELSPQDQKILNQKDPDFEQLSEEAQYALFLADKVMAADVPVVADILGKVDPKTGKHIPKTQDELESAYVKYHWRGNHDGTNTAGEAETRKHWQEALVRLQQGQSPP